MLTVAGIGPGGMDGMTIAVRKALEESTCIVGYTVYIELIRSFFPKKEYYTTPMTKEMERCRWAVEQAKAGKEVCMICSGDSGVYGMAGLILELADSQTTVRILPGVTAACSGAALLGAPIGHDFAVISLSDRLTPWEKIEQRLVAAIRADFSICLYNPASRGRPDYLQKACDILLQYAEEERVCGIVRNIGREGEEAEVMSLSKLRDYPADMFTTVYIGNSQTKERNHYMVTPRGYR